MEIEKSKNPVESVEAFKSQESIKCHCPYCNSNTATYVEYENGYLSFIVGVIVLLLVGLLPSLFLIPVALVITKHQVHKCSLCFNDLGNDGKIFNALPFEDKVLSFKIGEIGFIFTRKISLGVFLTIPMVLLIFYRISNINHFLHFEEPIYAIETTWPEFKDTCSKTQISYDPNSFINCIEKYIDRTVIHWKGNVIRVNDFRDSIHRYVHHAVTILVRMDPPEDSFFPDIILTFDSENAELNERILSDLERGDGIGFNATIKTLGNIHQTRHFHTRAIWAEGDKVDIPIHVHEGGRYADKPRFLKGNKDDYPIITVINVETIMNPGNNNQDELSKSNTNSENKNVEENPDLNKPSENVESAN